MKKLVFSLMLALAVLGGAVTVAIMTHNAAYADPSGNGGH